MACSVPMKFCCIYSVQKFLFFQRWRPKWRSRSSSGSRHWMLNCSLFRITTGKTQSTFVTSSGGRPSRVQWKGGSGQSQKQAWMAASIFAMNIWSSDGVLFVLAVFRKLLEVELFACLFNALRGNTVEMLNCLNALLTMILHR